MMSSGLNLVALGVGYIVYTTAAKEKEGVKFLGQGIGILIMIASVLCILCSSMAYCLKSKACGPGAGCPLMEKKQCSMMSREAAE
jgi:hypothetical protein